MQATIALSSGEAQLNSAVKGTSELIGFKEMLTDFNQEQKMELITDVKCLQKHTFETRMWKDRAPQHQTAVGARCHRDVRDKYYQSTSSGEPIRLTDTRMQQSRSLQAPLGTEPERL